VCHDSEELSYRFDVDALLPGLALQDRAGRLSVSFVQRCIDTAVRTMIDGLDAKSESTVVRSNQNFETLPFHSAQDVKRPGLRRGRSVPDFGTWAWREVESLLRSGVETKFKSPRLRIVQAVSHEGQPQKLGADLEVSQSPRTVPATTAARLHYSGKDPAGAGNGHRAKAKKKCA
jgi:hypothetical protein